ncbi:MAG: TRAP transporter permease [Inquilinus sp.]|nr:TRAP transporter permease [Inquilinus sp.]
MAPGDPISATPDSAALEARYDPELSHRPMGRTADWIVGALLVAMSAYHVWVGGFGPPRELLHRGIHLAFVLGLVFLAFGATRRGWTGGPRRGVLFAGGVPIWDWVLALGAAAVALYLPLLPIEQVAMRVGNPAVGDIVAGSVLLLVVLEAARRAMGWTLPIIIAVFLLYALFGRYAPGILKHPGASWTGLINHLYMTGQGIYGIAVGVVAKFVFLFVLFGVLATRIGLGQLFIDIAVVAAGRFAGGPAKVAVLSSGMLGMISGSSIANTVTTGSLTIPMMRRIGYPRHFAAAVEATASTGGQITPPIMGAAAFLMVEFLEIPYREVLLAAMVPALLHYFGVLAMVHLEAKKLGLRGLRRDEMPRLADVLVKNWPTLIPLGLLIFMILDGRSPDYAAFWGVVACVVVGVLNPRHRLGLRDLAAGMRTGAQYALAVGAAAAAVGIVIGVVTLTGTGFALSAMVTQSAAQLGAFLAPFVPFGLFGVAAMTLFFTLVFTAVACIIMGAGIPTTTTYIILVSLIVPALALQGVTPLVAHFFVFYYGVLADITPPVALAAYAAAGIAGADLFRTGNTAFRLAIAKALVPFVFVYSPAMLIVVDGFTWQAFAVTVSGAVIGIGLIGAAFTGFLLARMATAERWVLGAASLLFISPGLGSMGIGAVVCAPILIRQVVAWRRARSTSTG